MSGKAGTISVPVVQRFITEFPEKAVDVLMRCCHDPDIEKEIVQFLLNPDQQLKIKPRNTLDTTHISNAYVTADPITPPGSHRSGSFSGHRHTASRTHTAATRAKPDASPTRSNSTYSKSLASKSGKEDIIILATNEDDDLTKQIARMRSAQIEYSVIGEHMFSDTRICRSNIKDDFPEQQIAIPCRGAPGTYKYIPVSFRAELTWRRSSSDATHKTSFYLVPQEMLDIDVLLGTRDSGEDVMPSHPQKGAGFILQEHTMNTPKPIPNAHSFHPSSHVNDSSNTYQDEILQTLLRGQHNSVPQQRTPGSTRSKDTHASHTRHPSLISNTAASVVPVPTNSQPEKMRLSCKIDSILLNIWLDLDAHADAFLANVDDAFRKRKLVFDQTVTTILLKANPQVPDQGDYLLSLDEDDLEADWVETTRWLRINKNAISPHIFGDIQIEND